MPEPHDPVGDVFAAVADPTRRALLARLIRGPATVSELAEPFPISFNAVSKHLMVLERAGLLRREVEGRTHYCHLNARPLRQAADWLEPYRTFWEERLDALDELLAERRAKGRVRTRRRLG